MAKKTVQKTMKNKVNKKADKQKTTKKKTVKSVKKSAAKVVKPAKKIAKKPAMKNKNATKKMAKKAILVKAKSGVKAKPAVKVKPATKIEKVVSKIDFSNWVTPLDDRLLVQMSQSEKMTPGGLYIPETVADVSGNYKGIVVAVGRGHLDKKGKIHPLDVKKGDTIVFSQFSGSKIEYQGETVLFLREADVLGILNK